MVDVRWEGPHGKEIWRGIGEEHLPDSMERGTLLCIFAHATQTHTLRNFTWETSQGVATSRCCCLSSQLVLVLKSCVSASLMDWFCSQYACCRNFASSLNAWPALEGYPDSLCFWVQHLNCSINNYFPGQSFSAVVLYFCWENLFLFIWHHAGWQTGVQNRSCKSGLQKIQTTPKQKLCNIQIHSQTDY